MRGLAIGPSFFAGVGVAIQAACGKVLYSSCVIRSALCVDSAIPLPLGERLGEGEFMT